MIDVGVLIDRALSVIAPRAANRRLYARAKNRLLLRSTLLSPNAVFHDAARRDRLSDDWPTANYGADRGILPEVDVIRARSRDAVANTPWGKGVRSAFGENVVGEVGVLPYAAVTMPNDPEVFNDAWNDRTDDLFEEWATTPALCDVEERLTFLDIQRQVIEQRIEGGEFFVIWSIDRNRKFPLRLQRFEAEQLETGIQEHEGREVRGGVELSDVYAPVAYHFRKSDDYSYRSYMPGDTVRVPASRVWHVYVQDRPGQTRGRPELHACLRKIRDLDTWDMWSMEAAKVQASIALLIMQEEYGEGGGMLSDPDTGDTPGAGGEPVAAGQRENLFEAGMVHRGEPGEKIEALKTNQPNDSYSPYVDRQTTNIGTGAGVSGQTVTRTSASSYSAARTLTLQDRNTWKIGQRCLRDYLVRPARRLWLDTAVMRGTIVAPGFALDPDPWHKVDFVTASVPWVDPLKEAAAYISLNKRNLMSAQAIIANQGGRHWRKVMRQIAAERKYAATLGIETEATGDVSIVDTDDDGDPSGEGRSGNGRGVAHATRLRM